MRRTLIVAAVLGTALSSGVLPAAADGFSLKGPPKPAFLYYSVKNDGGWQQAFEEARVEVHDPKDRKKLAYLATTRRGRRVYVNRSAVDADQLVVLCRPDADPLLRRGGAGLLYPALSDEATREQIRRKLGSLRDTTIAAALEREAADLQKLIDERYPYAPEAYSLIAGPRLVHDATKEGSPP